MFLFDLHTLSIISLLLLSFYISITNITCKPETWSTFLYHTLSSVQLLGRVWLLAPWTAAYQASLSFTISHSLLKLISITLMIPSNHLVLCCPFSSCLQSFPASVSFQMSQFLTSGGQSTGVSALASVLPMNIQDWFPLGLTGLISLQWRTLKCLLYTTVQKRFFGFHHFGCINSSAFSFLYSPTLTFIHDYWKNHSFD